MRVVVLLLLVFFGTACSRTASPVAAPEKRVVQQEIEIPVPEAAKGLQDEIEAMTPVTLVPFEKLLPFLPPAPAGFTAGKGEGEAINTEEDKYAIVSKDYLKDGDDIRVVIMDAGRVKAKYRPILRWVGVVDEDTNDYTKGVNIDGNPGWEHFDRKFKTGNLHLMIGKRYLLTIHLNHVDRELMHTVYKSMDIKGLAALK